MIVDLEEDAMGVQGHLINPWMWPGFDRVWPVPVDKRWHLIIPSQMFSHFMLFYMFLLVWCKTKDRGTSKNRSILNGIQKYIA